ncbi:glycosyltransferase involved in cell wall biosynthesis [Chitinivorax tropicus]|uniref:Glycosyltransferase involved in cell wall biosynthesis n=1 Tax=Chitinivorax tropicus TaxID=714531 RepID=A0A840MQB4_9PROT|nr:glycosyltransferase family 2 protein [Chitinivorax tropicus]MBB5017441.1 glycosyltransferase involved in cell wall biosynthesis [Chitinivorax tropicus]
MFRPCVVIPVYNHEHAIGHVVNEVCAHDVACILVDDGCHAACALALQALAQVHPDQVTLVVHQINQGKGAAVLTGIREAARQGYTHVVQIDADGQHQVSDLPVFLSLAQHQPDALVIGQPIYDESVPKGRLYSRYLTHVWVWINTLSLDIHDSMCGFRVYPIKPVLTLADHVKLGSRMAFDTEILVRLHWQGLRVINQPTPVHYPLDGVSHFKLWRDNIQISGMHAILFFGMLWRLPRLCRRKVCGR